MNLVNESIVVTANLFNVTVVQQVWLVDNQIVMREEFTGPMLFTPGMVQVETPLFNLLAIPNQVQFTPLCAEEQKQQIILNRLGRFIELLPQTPYTAIGVNFAWHYRIPEGQTVAQVSRQAYFRLDMPGARLLDAPDARFGAYYSKDELGFRLKLSIAPVAVPRDGQPPEDVLQYAFNYHRDATRVPDLLDALNHWREAKEHSTMLVRQIEAEL
jgi:hypothetical protein